MNVKQISYFFGKANKFEIEAAEIAQATGLGGLAGLGEGGLPAPKGPMPKNYRKPKPKRSTVDADAPVEQLHAWAQQAFGAKMGFYTRG